MGSTETASKPCLLGIPFDGESSYLRGAGEAPAKIREAMRCDASNDWSETGVDLGVAGVYEDAGDLAFAEAEAFSAIEAVCAHWLTRGSGRCCWAEITPSRFRL